MPPERHPVPHRSSGPVGRRANTLSNVAIGLGIAAVVLLPIITGTAGIVCAVFARSKGEPKGTRALVVAVCGTGLGVVVTIAAIAYQLARFA